MHVQSHPLRRKLKLRDGVECDSDEVAYAPSASVDIDDACDGAHCYPRWCSSDFSNKWNFLIDINPSNILLVVVCRLDELPFYPSYWGFQSCHLSALSPAKQYRAVFQIGGGRAFLALYSVG